MGHVLNLIPLGKRFYIIKYINYLIFVGICGSFISVVADMFLAFFPQGIHGFETVFTVEVNKVFTVLSQASHTRLLFSNYLAMVGIPLGWFGLYYVYLNLRREKSQLILSCIFIVVGTIGYLCGTLFHVSLSFIATAFRIKLETELYTGEIISNMIELFIDFSQPLAYIFLAANFVISIIFFIFVYFGNSKFPKWFSFANPLCIQLVLAVIASVSPLSAKTYLTVSVYNFSLLIFYLLCYFVPKKELR